MVRVPYRSWRENPEAQVQRLIQKLNGTDEEVVPELIPGKVNSKGSPVAVEKHQWAIIRALKEGMRVRDDVLKCARKELNFARMGPKILANLEGALTELSAAKTVRIEEDEVFFSNEEARNREYTIAPNLFPRRSPRSRKRYRSRRW